MNKMNRLLHIIVQAVILVLIVGLIVASCEKEMESGILDVSVKTSSVSADAGSMYVKVRCAGDWTLVLSDYTWASISPSSGSGDKNTVVLSYDRNDGETKRPLTISVSSGKKTKSCSIVQNAPEKQPGPGDGQENDERPGQEPDGNLRKTGWLELPKMDDTGLKFFFHDFDMNGKTYRNYSFGWSQQDLVALWVAYPLCKTYTNKTTGRTDEWAYDPLLGQELSSAPFAGYGGDFARGHQLPSADRLCTREANEQTFYGTNLTPQLNQHNEGIWSNIEGKVRTWANTSDTTYVLTGCIVKGSTKFTTDSDGKKMTVPTAYYKAILRYHKASTISQWTAVGLYTEHKDYGSAKSDLKAVAMSIDELEDKTGMDFFVNLPAMLGDDKAAVIEAQNPKDAAYSQIWGW